MRASTSRSRGVRRVSRPRSPGHITLDELYDFVHDKLSRDAGQTPQRRSDGEGNLPIGRLLAPRPALRLSRDRIELDDVEVGEVLPPERIRVIGGSRDWTVTAHETW